MEIPDISHLFAPFNNLQTPPDSTVLALMKTMSQDNNLDCSEIAEQICKRVPQGTIIYYAHSKYSWPARGVSHLDPSRMFDMIKIPEKNNGKIILVEYCYHAVFSLGEYIYDPVLSNSAIVKSVYTELLTKWNLGNLDLRYTSLARPSFFKSGFF